MQVREVPHGDRWYVEALELRDTVLRRPIGLSIPEYQIEREKTDWHVVATEGVGAEEVLVGCLLLRRLDSETVQMKQVAVWPERQRGGVGTALVRESEQVARRLGFTDMMLHARIPAVAFYERLAYEIVGEEFMEVGIPHREMRKALE